MKKMMLMMISRISCDLHEYNYNIMKFPVFFTNPSMKRLFLFLLFSHLVLIIQAQDFILLTKQINDTINCKIISYEDGAIAYTTTESQEINYIKSDQISKCIFNQSKDEIICPVIVFDTLKCKIDSIVLNSIYYHINEYTAHKITINKSNVFSCHFDGNVSHDQLIVFLEKVRRSFILNRNKDLNILRDKNGHIMEAKILSINKQVINLEMRQNGKRINSYIQRANAASYEFNDFSSKPEFIQQSQYILSTAGTFKECRINKIDENSIYLDLVIGENKLVPSHLDKVDVGGIFFSNYESEKELPEVKHKDTRNLEFNGKAGIGYMIAALKDNIPDQLVDYNDALRSGFNFDVNMNYYLGFNSGIGLTFKYFHSSNSIKQINSYLDGQIVNSAEDNISILFSGINYIYSTSPERSLVYDFSIAAGGFIYKNKAVFNHENYEINALNYGINITNRLCLYKPTSCGIFVDLSLFIGNIKKYSVKDVDLELDTPDNISRVEIGMGFKFN